MIYNVRVRARAQRAPRPGYTLARCYLTVQNKLDFYSSHHRVTCPTSTMNNTSNTSCLTQFDTTAYKIATGLRVSLSFVSLLCILSIIGLVILFKKYRFFTQRLILYMCIAAAVSSLVGTLNAVATIAYTSSALTGYCVFIGFMDQYAGCCVLLAQTVLTLVVFLKVMFNKNTDRLEILYFVIIFFSPILICWIPFINQAYGANGPWCWITSTDQFCQRFIFGFVCQLLVWYIPLYLLMATLFIMLLVVIVSLHRRRFRWEGVYDPNSTAFNTTMEKEARPLIAYPLIFISLNFVLLINRLYNIINPGGDNEVLWFISAISYPLQGAIIALAYTLDADTRKNITIANIKAAVIHFRSEEQIKEYPIRYETGLSESLYIREN